jgi:magnesium-transporting ATPase (P-type)
MMSVVLKFPDGKIRIYCKGADSVITSKLNKSTKFLSITDKYLLYFARKGLRTLMVAYKDLSVDQYIQWNEAFKV